MRNVTLALLLSLSIPAAALAGDGPAFADTPPPTRASALTLRAGIGPSLYLAKLRAEDEAMRLTAPGVAIQLSVGRRFRHVHAIEVELTASIGPGPTLTDDGESAQIASASFSRVLIGPMYTHYARPADGRFVQLAVGAAFTSLDVDEETSSLGAGAFLMGGVGREWGVARGFTRVGLLGRATLEAYRSAGVDETYRGVALSVHFTVSMSRAGVETMPFVAPPPAPPIVIVEQTEVREVPVGPRERALRPSLSRTRRPRR